MLTRAKMLDCDDIARSQADLSAWLSDNGGDADGNIYFLARGDCDDEALYRSIDASEVDAVIIDLESSEVHNAIIAALQSCVDFPYAWMARGVDTTLIVGLE